MEGKEFETLKEDIEANGQAHPIIIYQGMILDGGNRYRALLGLGIEPHIKEYEGGDPTGFVLSCNLHRRHLAPGQAAAIVSAAQDWGKAQTSGSGGDRRSSATLHLNTAADRANASGTSIRTQKAADKLVKEAPTELVKEVTTGKKSLPKALEQLKPAKEPGNSAGLESTLVTDEPEPDPKDVEIAELKDRLDEMCALVKDQSEEIEGIAEALEGNEPLQAAHKEIKRLNAKIRVLEERLNGTIGELAEARRLAKSHYNKILKLEKEIKQLKGGYDYEIL
jgi:chromosome segregation ATPase